MLLTSSRPNTLTLPLDGPKRPVRMPISVDLPAPFCPSKQNTSPCARSLRHEYSACSSYAVSWGRIRTFRMLRSTFFSACTLPAFAPSMPKQALLA
jgi:hypothetical protein